MQIKKLLSILVTIVVIAALAFGAYSYYRLSHVKSDTEISTKVGVDDLITRLSQLYLVPNGEVPTIATVTDPEKIKEKAMFISVEVGDKVFLFTNAGKAVLYRPSLDKIVDIVSIKKN
jgi:hypothetical protein